ncbi:MAG TPA: hypothetical protein VNO19_01705 [Gemmatimonadales bacterium]|nr:hypothetical protein [Gemmatimonadales bacterium]
MARGTSHTILLLCGLIEIAIGIFGVWSLTFFRWVGSLTLGSPAVPRGAVMALVVNTAGSAFAAIAAVVLRLGNLGEMKSAYLAASVNLLVGTFILAGPLRRSPKS